MNRTLGLLEYAFQYTHMHHAITFYSDGTGVLTGAGDNVVYEFDDKEELDDWLEERARSNNIHYHIDLED